MSDILVTVYFSFPGRPCANEGYFRYKNSCNLHYRCYYSMECGKLIPSKVHQCPGCLKFNPKKMICDLPENVPECTYHSKDYQIFEGHKVTTPVRFCSGPGTYLDPSDRTRYYSCVDIHKNNNYYLTIRDCPSNTTFNEVNNVCEGNRSTKKYMGAICNSHNYAVDLFNCQKFYFCRDQRPVEEFSCLKTHIFNGHFCQHKSKALVYRY